MKKKPSDRIKEIVTVLLENERDDTRLNEVFINAIINYLDEKDKNDQR